MASSGDSHFLFDHVPLGPSQTGLGDGWCVELPTGYAANAVVLVWLTATHPTLMAHAAWAAHLSDRLNAAAETAHSGDIEESVRAWRSLKVAARNQPATCLPILGAIEQALPTQLLQELKNNAAKAPGEQSKNRGDRFKPQTLEDHDAVRLQAEKDRISLSFEVSDGNGVYTRRNSNGMRAYEVVKSQRIAHGMVAQTSPDDIFGESGKNELRRVLDHHRDVTKATKVLYYALTRCREHIATSPCACAKPEAWHAISPDPPDEIMRSRTITFQPLTLLSQAEFREFGKKVGGKWMRLTKPSPVQLHRE